MIACLHSNIFAALSFSYDIGQCSPCKTLLFLQFLGLLADISAVIRCAARKVLQLMMLPDIKTFKSAVDCLITNLETYPEVLLSGFIS